MKTRILFTSCVFLAALAVVARADDAKAPHAKAGGSPPAFEQFKQLAGDWVGKGTFDGKDEPGVHVNYKVTSAGSTVVETMGPGTPHEMVTTIHPDLGSLVLTHYCALGNQPHMKADGKLDGNKVAFKFTHATNMKSDKDMHMHDVTFTFVDKDTLKVEWTHFDDGKAAGNAVFEVKRQKASGKGAGTKAVGD